MDRATELAHLAIAEKAVANGERHILQQEQRVAKLDLHGHDTGRARATLVLFRKNHAEQVAHRDLVLKILPQETKSNLASGPVFRPGHYDPPPAGADTGRNAT